MNKQSRTILSASIVHLSFVRSERYTNDQGYEEPYETNDEQCGYRRRPPATDQNEERVQCNGLRLHDKNSEDVVCA